MEDGATKKEPVEWGKRLSNGTIADDTLYIRRSNGKLGKLNSLKNPAMEKMATARAMRTRRLREFTGE